MSTVEELRHKSVVGGSVPVELTLRAATEIDTLKHEVERLRTHLGNKIEIINDLERDKERLDWLEITKVCDAGRVWLEHGGIEGKHCGSLRVAIDAAMAKEKA